MADSDYLRYRSMAIGRSAERGVVATVCLFWVDDATHGAFEQPQCVDTHLFAHGHLFFPGIILLCLLSILFPAGQNPADLLCCLLSAVV